jgi:hypothetical protein
MTRSLRHRWPVVAVLFFAVVAHQSFADPPDILRDYRFITSKSTVHVTGGPEGYDIDLAIDGDFGLVTGYDYSEDPTTGVPTIHPFAQFVAVDAILFNPLSMAPMPVPGWDLDDTLNLSGLDGTFQIGNPTQLFFHGEDGQGQPIQLEGTLQGRLLHLVGENDPGGGNLYHYQVDALAYLKPYPDWNSDDVVDAADYVALRKAPGMMEEYGAWETDFAVSIATDGSSSHSTFGGAIAATMVPEPATGALLFIAALAFACRRHPQRN